MAGGREKAARSVAWSAIEGGGLSIISFLSLVAFSRLLSPGDFGLFATALSIIELLSLITNLAFHDALVQVPTLTRSHRDTAFTLNVATSVALFLLTWSTSGLFAQAMHDPKAASLLAWMGGSFLLAGPSATLTAQQRREFRFKTLALRSLIGRIAGSMLGIAAAFAGWGVWALVVQQLAMAGLSSAVLWALADDRPHFGFERRVARQLVAFGIAAAGAEVVNAGIKRLFVTACGLILGAGPAGYINIAFRLIDTLWGVASTAIYQVVLPVMARMQDDPATLHRVFRRAQSGTCVVLYFLFACLSGGAVPVIALLFGERWVPAAPYVAILGAMTLLQVPRMLTVPVLTAMGRPRDVLTGYATGIAYMAAVLLVVPFDGPYHALGIWFGTELVYTPVFVWLLRRGSGIGPWEQARTIAGPALAALATALAIHFVSASVNIPILALILSGFAGATVFVTILFVVDRKALDEAAGLLAPLLPYRLRANR